MQLRASCLKISQLLRICTHCPQIHTVKLEGTHLSDKVLAFVLNSLPGLKKLMLDLPMEDSLICPEDDMESVMGMDKVYGIDDGPHGILKTIDVWAPPTLEYVALTLQVAMKIPDYQLRSLLRNRPGLRTLKFVEVDIVGLNARKIKKKGKGRGKDRGQRSLSPSSVSSTTTATTTGSSSGSSRSSTPNLSTTSMERTLGSATGTTANRFGLHFLSIASTHTSALVRILDNCPFLTTLHLHYCDSIKDTALETISLHTPSLTSISLSSCKQLTSIGLESFFNHPDFSFVHVHFCNIPGLRDQVLDKMVMRHGHTLRKLAVYYCAFVTENGIKSILTQGRELRVLGLQSYSMTYTIFENSWACQHTLEQLDLQGTIKRQISAYSPNSTSDKDLDLQARVAAFVILRNRVMALSGLKNLRLSANGIGKEILEGFGPQQPIRILHLYGMQSAEIQSLPWSTIRMRYPYLEQLHCGTAEQLESIGRKLAGVNVELLSGFSIPDLASVDSFDD
ncbi:hypothetical protein BG011_005668 [Mortierella polycephala]|uniref:RNI-like protein n=1 Tax=Mortierella polycephala TaxID=41804 RepID=A0A9P6PWP5_9FUNG|nr:hypothetical protein BG011_005668 [Mortierella polycephala]